MKFRPVLALTCAAFLSTMVGPLKAQTINPNITWEVANRFPLFKAEDQFRAIVDVFNTRGDRLTSPSLALESELELRAAERKLGPAFGDASAAAQYGWASAVVRNTCFQSGNHGHVPCKTSAGDQFVQPDRTDVLLTLNNLPNAANRNCSWSIQDMPPVRQRCDQTARLKKVPLTSSFAIRVEEGGTELAKLEGQSARLVTIVGFGDSFASGEGNPDRAAALGDIGNDYDRTSLLPGEPPVWGRVRLYPLRPDATPQSLGPRSAALWLNAQCHRSLYSQQLKAALQLAIEEPHLQVQFLGYACTGAEVTDGILGPWKARSDVSPNYYDDAPQLIKFLRDACANPKPYQKYSGFGSRFDWRTIPTCGGRRLPKIDAVLLSIGGNDVGFSNVIAHEVVDVGDTSIGLRRLMFRLWLKAAGPIPFDEAKRRATNLLPGRYSELSQALATHVGVSPSNIIQTAYPQLTDRGGAQTCGASTAGMDVHQILGMRKATTGPEAKAFVTNFNGLIRDAVDKLGANAWRFVDTHVSGFAGHALCQEGAPNGSPLASMSGAMQFPLRRGGTWSPFKPTNWRAYLPRNRWFVTPNDAFLTGNYMNTSDGTPNPRDKVQPLYAATLSGAFHPNALGHAAIADAVIPELRRALKLTP